MDFRFRGNDLGGARRYSIRSINPVIPPSETGEHLVADSAGGLGEIIDRHFIADQRGDVAAPGAASEALAARG